MTSEDAVFLVYLHAYILKNQMNPEGLCKDCTSGLNAVWVVKVLRILGNSYELIADAIENNTDVFSSLLVCRTEYANKLRTKSPKDMAGRTWVLSRCGFFNVDATVILMRA